MSDFESVADFASKVEWEGGIVEALDYGIKPKDVPEEIRPQWQELSDMWKKMEPLLEEVSTMLEDALMDEE